MATRAIRNRPRPVFPGEVSQPSLLMRIAQKQTEKRALKEPRSALPSGPASPPAPAVARMSPPSATQADNPFVVALRQRRNNTDENPEDLRKRAKSLRDKPFGP